LVSAEGPCRKKGGGVLSMVPIAMSYCALVTVLAPPALQQFAVDVRWVRRSMTCPKRRSIRCPMNPIERSS
jgi:hypothetical protein